MTCVLVLRPAAKQSTPWPELTIVVEGNGFVFLSPKSMSMGIIFVRFLVFSCLIPYFVSLCFLFLLLSSFLLDWVTFCYFLQFSFPFVVAGV